MSNKEIIVVIARYNKELDWLEKLKLPFVIYNKGNDDLNYDYIKSENVGRESETFIRYIIDDYDNLPNKIVFLQDDPFYHSSDVINKINNYIGDSLLPLSDWITDSDLNGCPHHCGLSIKEYISMYIPEMKINNLVFASGAQYIVPKQYILTKPLIWWKKIYNTHFTEQNTPWILERLWSYIYKFEFR